MAAISLDAAAALVKVSRARGQTVVLTSGTFDLLHPGHVRALTAAKSEGDVLLVIVRSDQSAGASGMAPHTPERERTEIVAATAAVDAAAVAGDEAFVTIAETWAPDVLVISSEAGATESAAGQIVSRGGGRVVPPAAASSWSTETILAKVRRS
jgi:D-beta-D-heptose 7-phosphate kinase/D-beta-D-heptose 1-phosphate adenosyltransferase